MPKNMTRNMPKTAERKTGGKCTCNLSQMVGAWILFAIGLYLLVWGFAGQFNNTESLANVLVAYFIGFVVVSLGKMAKWKAHGTCPVHGMKM